MLKSSKAQFFSTPQINSCNRTSVPNFSKTGPVLFKKSQRNERNKPKNPRAQPRFRNGGVHLSFLSYKRSTTAVIRRRGKRNLEGVYPSPANWGIWGSVASSPSWVWGRAKRKRFWRVSCAILRDFTYILVHLTAVWKWEIPTSLYRLVGVMFPFNYLGVLDTPT